MVLHWVALPEPWDGKNTSMHENKKSTAAPKNPLRTGDVEQSSNRHGVVFTSHPSMSRGLVLFYFEK